MKPSVNSEVATRTDTPLFFVRETVLIPKPNVTLDLLRYESFRKAMEALGIKGHLRIDELGRESGYVCMEQRR
jgi:hypothetical protein